MPPVGAAVVELAFCCLSAVVGFFLFLFLFAFLLNVFVLFPPQYPLLGVVLSGPAAVLNGVALFIKRGESLFRESESCIQT